MEPTSSSLGKRLRHAREIKSMTQAELSAKSGVSKGTISTSERDRTELTTSNLRAICTTLGVSADYVIFGDACVRNEEWENISVSEDGLALRQCVLNLWQQKRFVPLFSGLVFLRDEDLTMVLDLIDLVRNRRVVSNKD